MRFDEFATFLSGHGVKDETIEQIYKEITASKVLDSLK